MTTTIRAESDEVCVSTGTLPIAASESPGHSSLVVSGMIVLAAVAMVGTLPGRTHGLGLITEGLLSDLHLERADYARINLVATLIGAMFCWPWGWLLDRIGIRMTGAAVLLLLGVSTIGIAESQTPAGLSVWITLSRGFGQSMLSVVSITLCGRASLGLRHATAMAGYSLLVSLFFMGAFRLMGVAIPAVGWRTAWLSLGWIVVISAPIFGLLVVEHGLRATAARSIPTPPWSRQP